MASAATQQQGCEDIYEPDNTVSQAISYFRSITTDGTPQHHTNTPSDEEDWVYFTAIAGHHYDIRTQLTNDINEGDTAANDTMLYLYDQDETTQLAFNDDVGYKTWYLGYYYYRESIISWTAPASGTYYVRELQWGPTAKYFVRDCHSYDLWVVDLPLTTAASGPVAIGSTITDTAHIYWGDFSSSGTLFFDLFAPGDTTCSNTPIWISSTLTVNGIGDYTSTAYTPVGVGDYRWIAHYHENATNRTVDTFCNDTNEISTVNRATPILTTTASGPVTVGGDIQDIAHLSSGYNLGGTISFSVYAPGDTSCTTALAPPPASATVNGPGDYTSGDFSTTIAGDYRWIANYLGDANNNAVSSACGDSNESSTVNTPTPTVTPTPTFTLTQTSTGTPTPTSTLTATSTGTPTLTFTLTTTTTSTQTPTPTLTPTPILLDPPSGIKSVDDSGLPVLKWTMVWINNSNIVALNSAVHDPIPVNSSYVPGSISCTSGSLVTVTTSCDFEAPSLANPRGRVTWTGSLGPDYGITDPALAVNAIHISFNVTIAPGAKSVQNDATVDADLNGNGKIDPGEVNLVHATAKWISAPIPATGYAPNQVTILPVQNLSYLDLGDLWLEIPRLGVQVPIVGVPKTSTGWDVSWLGKQAGWLNGTAFPTWPGNSVLTAHVYDAFGQPGPFVALNRMWWNDQIIIHAWGTQYVYAVREVLQVDPGALAAVIQHKDLPWVTLVTCRGFDPAINSYKYRVIVRGVLVDVR